MKRKAIVEETRLIKQATEKLPVEKRDEGMVRGLYKAAAQEVSNERKYDPEKYMYMSDDDLAEIIRQKFDEKMSEITGSEAPEEEKPEEIDVAEDEFAEEMEEPLGTEEPIETEEPFGSEEIPGEEVAPESDEALEEIFGPLEGGEELGEEEVSEEEKTPVEGEEGSSEEEKLENPESSAAEEINKE